MRGVVLSPIRVYKHADRTHLMQRMLLGLWLIALLPTGSALARDLIHTVTGELPIIIAAPHGGRTDVPGCEMRTATGTRFVNRPDHNTDRLAQGIATELKRLTGQAPYLVIARFHRKFIDANRSPEEAYGAEGCAADYDDYHAVLRRYVDDIRAKHPQAMLFDIHGQSAYRNAILRGTRHGETVTRLLARAGAAAVTGPDSVFGRFAAMGHAIVPSNDTAPTDRVEAKNYIGGYTVARYGSHRADGIDAMQLEFGRDFRNNDNVERTAQDAAQAIAAFYARYLR